MEGFLFKKGRGDSSFGRRNWKKRWFVLEGSEVSYYEDFDLNSGMPIGFKDKVSVLSCECIPVTHHDKKHTFVVKPADGQKELHLQAPDAKLMNLWVKEVVMAARGEQVVESVDYEQCYELLGLKMEDDPSPADVNRAYRKAALKCHPDKGGDLDKFEKIQKAFNDLMAKVEEEEYEREHRTVLYDAVLRKEPGEVGLGMVVLEDAIKKVIQIKDILPGMKIEDLSPEADGGLRPGDVLVAIGGINVRKMPLSRVAQKLNAFRVPIHSTVKLTFERKVPRTTLDPDAEPNAPNQSTKSSYEPSTPGAGTGGGYESESSPTQRRPFSASENANPNLPTQREEERDQSKNGEAEGRTGGSYTNDAVLAENDELKTDLFAKMKALDTQRQENTRLEKELERHKSYLWMKARENEVLEAQLQLSFLSGKMGKEALGQSMTQVLAVSHMLAYGKVFEQTPEIAKVLRKENLTFEETRDDPVRTAQRLAVTAALTADVSKVLVHKWLHEREGIANRLATFEAKLENMDLTSVRSASQSQTQTQSQGQNAPAPVPAQHHVPLPQHTQNNGPSSMVSVASVSSLGGSSAYASSQQISVPKVPLHAQYSGRR